MQEVKIPKVSMGQTEGTICDWLVEEGTWVEKDQLIMVMDTEKVSYELESPETGFIIFQIELNETYPCGTIAALLAESEEEKQELLLKKQAIQVAKQIPESIPSSTQIEKQEIVLAQAQSDSTQPIFESRRIKITPVAKKMAEVHELDYSLIKGTGPNGRIKMCDIDKALANRSTQTNRIITNTIPSSAPIISVTTPKNVGLSPKKTIPLSGVRKAVANNVKYSQQLAAQTHFVGEVDVKQLMKFRKRLNAKLEGTGDKIGYNDLLIYIMAKAIKKVPIVNSSLIDGQIMVWENINIGLAVAIELNEYESGLYVPVIQQADQKSLVEISRETKEKVAKARDGQLTVADSANGTITLSPLGSVVNGYSTSTPIIQQPQAFIINSGAISERVVPVKGKMKIRPIMTLSCTFDHRIMDGVPALKYFNVMKGMIEDLDQILL